MSTAGTGSGTGTVANPDGDAFYQSAQYAFQGRVRGTPCNFRIFIFPITMET